jgi:DUF218 domain-containing protein
MLLLNWKTEPTARWRIVQWKRVGNCIRPPILLAPFPVLMQKPQLLIGALLVLVALLLACVPHSGSFLVVENVRNADAILVLAGDVNDRRYQKGIELLRAAYGRQLLLDASEDVTLYGHSYADWARQFVKEDSTEVRDRVQVCPIREDSTATETRYAARCLSDLPAGSRILLVTSDYHTRRALSVFSNRLPSYQWSVAAAYDATQFGIRWWQHRQWAKNALKEWQKLMWWEVVERWG